MANVHTNTSARGVWHGGKLVPPGGVVDVVLPKRFRDRLAALATELRELGKGKDAAEQRAAIEAEIAKTEKEAKDAPPSAAIRGGLLVPGVVKMPRPRTFEGISAPRARNFVEIEESPAQLQNWASIEKRPDVLGAISERLAKIATKGS
jgi:hypothetical protein